MAQKLKWRSIEDVFQVFIDGWHLHPKQLRQRLLRQPDDFVFEKNLHLHCLIGRGVEKKLILSIHGFITFWIEHVRETCRLAPMHQTIDQDIIPLIVTQPQGPSGGQPVMAGTLLKLAVAATGAEPLNYQWLKDGVALQGQSRPALVIASVAASDAGVYSVKVSNAAGSVSSDRSCSCLIFSTTVWAS